MARITITVGGRELPARPTMGAMLRFKRETGRDVSEIGNELSDILTYLYCCVASACKVDGIEFTMSLMDFADALEPEEMESWTTAQQGDAETDGDEAKKK